MGSDEREGAVAEGQDNYEAAVLDFLDKEMSAIRPSQKKNEHSEELDALVSDLLKQVITEADQPKETRKAASSELDAMLSEFPPKEEADSPRVGHALDSKASSPSAPAGVALESIAEPVAEPSRAQKPADLDALPIFTPPRAAKSRMPMVVIASACLMVIVGIAVYHFANASKGDAITESRAYEGSAAPAVPAVQNQVLPASTQPDRKAAGLQEIRPTPEKNPAGTTSSNTASLPAQKPALSGDAPAPAAVQQSADKAKGQSEPVTQTLPGAPAGGMSEKAQNAAAPTPPAGQAATPAVQLSLPGSAIEKPALSPMPDVAGGTKKPGFTVPIAPSSSDNSAATTLVPAVPIFQVSPSYPEIALRTRASALVVLDLDIDAQGNVVKVTPVSGPPMFHDAAVTAAMKWRYKPASLGGAHVASKYRVSMNFKLK